MYANWLAEIYERLPKPIRNRTSVSRPDSAHQDSKMNQKAVQITLFVIDTRFEQQLADAEGSLKMKYFAMRHYLHKWLGFTQCEPSNTKSYKEWAKKFVAEMKGQTNKWRVYEDLEQDRVDAFAYSCVEFVSVHYAAFAQCKC